MSSMQGHYSDTNLPLLAIPFQVTEDRFIDVEVVVDSGFNRGLIVYEADAIAAKLAPSRRFDETLYVANGSMWPAQATTAYVMWLGKLREVDVLVVEAEPPERRRSRKEPERGLVGMELLRGTELVLGASTVQLSPEEG